jgi:hypothetical protein
MKRKLSIIANLTGLENSRKGRVPKTGLSFSFILFVIAFKCITMG